MIVAIISSFPAAGPFDVPVPGVSGRRSARFLRDEARAAWPTPLAGDPGLFRQPPPPPPPSSLSSLLLLRAYALVLAAARGPRRKLFAERGPGATPGRLTEERSLAVRNDTLAQVAARLGLARHLRHCARRGGRPCLCVDPSQHSQLRFCVPAALAHHQRRLRRRLTSTPTPLLLLLLAGSQELYRDVTRFALQVQEARRERGDDHKARIARCWGPPQSCEQSITFRHLFTEE